ncbi:hypothetical protein [Conexivisphaera calida]|uniref:Uncharacterized protein n=1 Tax=Conexivisphaera calida TaxID=1874277 RepID=A0A4P2VG63_9ARCH|nr:hypothetical protein [Conexivisphaera calida]BBE42453.1 hypothetical protein NAS2_1064 [Conexivisphaera calida]
MRRVIAILIVVLVMVVALIGLATIGIVYLTPQYKYYIDPAWSMWNQPVPYPPATDPVTNAQYPPVYAILHFYPNGSATAEAWVYDPNTVPIKIGPFGINPVFIIKNSSVVWCNLVGLPPVNSSCPTAYVMNNSPVWWGLDGQPPWELEGPSPINASYPAGVIPGEVLPFTFAYTNVWGAVYPGPGHSYGYAWGTSKPVPPGLLVGNGTDEYFAFYLAADSPLGWFQYYEPFVYVGNGTWVATPGTGYLHRYHGPYTYWQVWPQEIPPGWPYPNLVNVTSAPLPPWWGRSSYPSRMPRL